MSGPAECNLALFNVARLVADAGDPRVSEFENAIDMVYAVAERTPGFIWRLDTTSEAEAQTFSGMIDGDPRLIFNLSLWADAESLENYVWNTLHGRFYQRRAEWFEKLPVRYLAMWWLPEGQLPTLDDGIARLEKIRVEGPSEEAFDWSWLEEAQLWRTKDSGAVT